MNPADSQTTVNRNCFSNSSNIRLIREAEEVMYRRDATRKEKNLVRLRDELHQHRLKAESQESELKMF